MEVKIHIDSECPVPYQTSDLKTNLNNVECIGDLKKKLQPLLSVAACDMSVYHKTRRELENREKISNLYVREGDTFIVKFISVCNLHLLSKFLDDMRAFVKDVCEAFSDGDRIMENIDWNADSLSAVDNCYETVLANLDICNQDMFSPWKSKPTKANKHYFVQEGGLDLLATIYNFASKKQYPLATIWYVRGYGARLAQRRSWGRGACPPLVKFCPPCCGAENLLAPPGVFYGPPLTKNPGYANSYLCPQQLGCSWISTFLTNDMMNDVVWLLTE